MPQKITDSELVARVDQELRQAQDYMGGKLAQQRRKALQYYMAQPEGDLAPPEIEGRSTVVATDVADTIEWMLPSLLKIFTASDRVVQFNPRKPGRDQMAEDATDYLNWIFSVKNPGFQLMHTQLKDGLLSKMGILKIWWDERREDVREDYEGLSDWELAEIVNADGVEIIEHDAQPDEQAQKQKDEMLQRMQQQAASIPENTPQAQQMAMQMQALQSQPVPVLHDISIRRTKSEPGVRIEAVPPEEFFVSRRAKRLADAPFVAHVREWTISDLRAEGHDIADDEIPQDDGAMVGRSMERVQRWSYDDATAPFPNMWEPPSDPSMRTVWVVEAYLRADVNGDGIAEWRRVLKVGTKILENIECDGNPFALWTPIPMPHRLIGLSVADLAMPAQLQKTALQRAIHDNLYLSVNERYFAVDGQVNLDDLLTSRPGGVVRIKSPGAVGPLSSRSGDLQGAYQLLEYVEGQKEQRVGWTHNSRGADANALHPTATGQQIVTNRDDMRLELIARVYAETGLRDAFVRILELVCRYQRSGAQFRLNGRWLEIDPREWRDQFDVTISVGLGSNDTQQRLQQIMQLIGMQGHLLQSPINAGMIGPKEAHAAFSEAVKTLGFKDSGRFIQDPANVPPQPPQPNPEQIKAQSQMQIEQAKLQASMQIEQAKAQMQAEVDRNRQAAEAEQHTIKIQHEAQLEQLKAQMQDMQHQRDMEFQRWKTLLEADTKINIAQISAQTTLSAKQQAAANDFEAEEEADT